MGNNIPENVVVAAVGLLSPFGPGMTADKLKKAIFTEEGAAATVRPEFTRAEAAKRLGLSTRTIDLYMAKGTLRYSKVGPRRVLICPDDVNALLAVKPAAGVTA